MLLERQTSLRKHVGNFVFIQEGKVQTESRRVIVKTQPKVPSYSWRWKWQFQRQMLYFQRCCLLEPMSVPLGHSPPSPPGRRDNVPSSMSEEECGPDRPSTSRGCDGGSSAFLQPPNPTSTQNALKGSHTHGRLSQRVLCILYPKKGPDSVMLTVWQ